MNVTNQKNFFQNIALDENGNMIVVLSDETPPTEKGVNQNNFFNKISITPEGYLKIYKA
jgi:hypothetical protein